ncbi:BYS1 domain-containing protein [Histoplasma capsulatum var. duboisii H88]|uniref:BYS1 domain-containing protein n=1 Tax=Ajellomyces capsulatus (strain H88) TaxID=544711 RepID=F0U6H1_AJEC8|nr:BYS1 domain-containing protein [Histoplasma capsulatum var. duboisii H88]QSS51293.1 BYS1 domain-containing protein [Histoplasma capsulatum var. duboisii H88]
MYTKSVITAVTAFATLIPSILAGKAVVSNDCRGPVYLWSVGGAGPTPMKTIRPNSTYDENFRNPPWGGVSLKISKKPTQNNITQFEYTLVNTTVWYDISNIDGNPFRNDGYKLTTNSSCPEVHCPPSNAPCNQVYNHPDDNWATHACSSTARLVLTLCTS